MKVYEIQKFDLESLNLVDRPDPEPGANQVLVKMHAWSLNYRDLLTITGRYNPRLKLPQIPLSDGAGEVVAITLEMQRLAANLTRQVAQFKIHKGSTPEQVLPDMDDLPDVNPGE